MSYGRTKDGIALRNEIRYAVIDKKFKEVMTSNHRVIGEAFNAIDDFVNNKNLIVVATQNDLILGKVNTKGKIVDSDIGLPDIWADRRALHEQKLKETNELSN